MANKFDIRISAVDRATATIRKINESMSRLTRPVSQMGRSIKALARESGLTRFGKSLGKVGHAAGDVARKIGSIVAPFMAVIGVGSIAGVSALAVSWGRLGFEIGQTSLLIGISTQKLQALRGAAAVMGISSGELTGGLRGLGNTLEDALYGRNQQALMMLGRMGIGIHHTANGAIDSARAFTDLSRAISRMKNPQAQEFVANAFGLGAALPILRQGPAAIAAYEAKVKSLGGVLSDRDVASAQRFGVSMNYLKIAFQGLKNAISAKLLPVLQPYIDRLTQWISANRKLIATRITQFVQKLADYLSQIDWKSVIQGVNAFFSGVQKLVSWLGGWKHMMIGIGVVMSAGLIANVVKLGIAITELALGLGKLNAAGGGLGLGLLKKLPLGALGEVGAAGYAGYMAGKHIFKPAIDWGVQAMTGEKGITLGTKVADWLQPGYSPNSPSIMNGATGAHPAAATAPHQVHVEVVMKNAPPGTTVTAKTPQGEPVPARVMFSMPTLVMP